MDEDNCDVSENEQEDETEKSLEEQQSSGETVQDDACCINELSLAEQEADKEESGRNQEDDNQDGQKTLQGTENTSFISVKRSYTVACHFFKRRVCVMSPQMLMKTFGVIRFTRFNERSERRVLI